MPYPKVSIKFCTKCKWNLRASWNLQELLQTFGEKLGEVSLVPSESGVFKVEVQKDENSKVVEIWDRKTEDGFPDSKILKQKVRNIAFPSEILGHVDKENKNDGKLITETKTESSDMCIECHQD